MGEKILFPINMTSDNSYQICMYLCVGTCAGYTPSHPLLLHLLTLLTQALLSQVLVDLSCLKNTQVRNRA